MIIVMLKKIINNKVFKIIGNIIYTICFLLVLSILIVVCIQRFSNNNITIGGMRIFSVVTGSMIPKYEIGDIIISKEIDASEINVGDDITYKAKKGDLNNIIITHQVIEKRQENEKYKFITKGIANDTADPEIDDSQIYGKVIYKSVILSFINKITRNLYAFYFLIIVPMAIIVAKIIVDFILRRQEIKEEKESEEQENISEPNKDIKKKEQY